MTRAGTAVDTVTPEAMVLLQDRPVVAFTSWMAAALQECTATDRMLQIVTPETSRLSMPMRTALSGRHRWVVQAANAYHDGLTGMPLQWSGQSFVPPQGATDYAPRYLIQPSAPLGHQLTLTVRIRHDGRAKLGEATERISLVLQGRRLAGWGTAEPATRPWSADELTEVCRSRPGSATWLTFVGPRPKSAVADQPLAVQGTMLCAPDGAEESVTLMAGYPPGVAPPLTTLPMLVSDIAERYMLLSLSAQLSPGRPDLTTEPRWSGSPSPVGLAIAAELGGGSQVPQDIPVRRTGPVWWYDLGDGRSAEGWQRYQRLMASLQPQS